MLLCKYAALRRPAALPLPLCRLSSGEHIGIPLAVEEETQKYFPASNSAQQVRDRLVAACQRRGVEMR